MAGVEALVGVSSAEITTYEIKGYGLDFCIGNPSILEGSLTLYKGYVWNLWNAKDYEGSFGGISSAGVGVFGIGKTGGIKAHGA